MLTTDELRAGDLVTVDIHGKYLSYGIAGIRSDNECWLLHLMRFSAINDYLLMRPWKAELLDDVPWLVNVKRGSVVLHPQEAAK